MRKCEQPIQNQNNNNSSSAQGNAKSNRGSSGKLLLQMAHVNAGHMQQPSSA